MAQKLPKSYAVNDGGDESEIKGVADPSGAGRSDETPDVERKPEDIELFLLRDAYFQLEKVRQQVEEERDRTRMYLDIVSVIVLALDKGGNVTMINRAGAKLLGGEPEDIIGKNWLVTFIPETVQADVLKVFKTIMESSEPLPQSFEFATNNVLTLDGQERTVEWHNVLLRDERGEPIGTLSSGLDITDRQRLQEEARRKSELAQLYLNVSAAIIVAYDLQGKIININEHGAQVLGIKREDVAGRRWFDFVPAEYRSIINKLHEWSKQSDRVRPIDYHESPLNTEQGERWYGWTYSWLNNESGEHQGIICSGIDITTSKQAEKEINREREKFRRIYEASNDALILFEGEKIISTNEAMVRLFKYESEENLLKKTIGDLFPPIQPNGRNSREAAQEHIDFAFAEGKDFFEWTHRRADGTDFISTILLTPIVIDEKKLIQATIRDVSQEKIAEEKVRNLDRLKSRFITALTHMTKTPLNRIRWSLEGLESGDFGEISEEGRTLIRQALDSEDEVLRVIQNMNTALDIERGTLSLDRRPASLVSLVLSVKGRLAEMPQAHDIEWVENIENGQSCLVNIDVERMRNVLIALIDNAIRYLGKQERKITISVNRDGQFVRCEIIDTGVGIPEAEKSYVFERFYRASNAQLHHTDGMGLDLHIAKSLVEAQGGQIGFDSQEGHGTTFWFTLPVA
ncbi:MAG: PAS domain-containing sensor histidine kinase [Patescibacteria group bacterium]